MDFSLGNDSDSLGIFTTLPDLLSFILLDAGTGHELWQKSFSMSGLNFSYIDSRTSQIQNHTNGYMASWIIENVDGSEDIETCIMHLGANGNPISWKRLGAKHKFDQLYVGNDGVYLLGSTTEEFSFAENNENLILAKLDFDLEPIWTRVFHAEEFEFNNATLSIGNTGGLTLGYSTYGYFPTILAKLNPDGEIIEKKGYPLFEPEIDVMSDGSLVMLSRLPTGVPFHWENIIAKTDTAGIIDGCPDFMACLESTEIMLNADTFILEESPVLLDTLESVQLKIEPVEFSFSDHCDIPPEPSPYFFVPDTVCVMDSVVTADLENINAHGILWNMVGPEIDTTIRDSFEFQYRFNVPGEYYLSQSVWYLGCRYDFQRTITVLPEIDVFIDKEGVFCEPPIDLNLELSRLDVDIVWGTGENTESILATQDDIYVVDVSDGFCTAKDSVNVSFVSSQFNSTAPLHLPPDTSICEQSLPYMLWPESDFSNDFFLDFQIVPETPIALKNSGEYDIAVEIDNCFFSEKFQLDIEECSPAIYFPNAFSPNGDGINDEFFPQGNNYEAISLSIYDRWGGLIHCSKGASVSWDGADVPIGVYVYVFEYIESLSGDKKQLTSDVTVLR